MKWRAPASNGGAAITGYRVIVKKGTRTLVTKHVGPARRSVIVRKARLRDGWHKVIVQAKNPAGLGSKSTKRFRINK